MKNTDKTGNVQGLRHFITLPSAFILFICGWNTLPVSLTG